VADFVTPEQAAKRIHRSKLLRLRDLLNVALETPGSELWVLDKNGFSSILTDAGPLNGESGDVYIEIDTTFTIPEPEQ